MTDNNSEDKIVQKREYMNMWRMNNKEHLKQYMREYNRKYKTENRDKCLDYYKSYYQQNKEKMKQQIKNKNKKFCTACNKIITYYNKHIKTDKHKKNFEQLNTLNN